LGEGFYPGMVETRELKFQNGIGGISKTQRGLGPGLKFLCPQGYSLPKWE